MGGKRALAALLALAGLVAAGCSGDDDEGSASTTRDERSTTADAPASSSRTTAPPEYSGDPGSPFCTLLRATDPATVLSGDAEDPASVEAAFARLTEVLADALDAAPPEISDDVALVAAGIGALDGALAAAGYDFQALATSEAAAEISAAVNDPAFVDAGARLSAYRGQVCGL